MPRARVADTIIGREASAALQGSSVGSCAVHVGSDTTANVCSLLVANVFDTLGRDTNDQTMGWEFLILRHQSASSDYRPLPDLCSVEDRGVHADEAAVANLAAVQDRLVSDHAALPHHRRITGVRVQHAAVLDVRTRPYPDGLSVPAQHGPVPDARLLPKMHVPDNVGPRRHPR